MISLQLYIEGEQVELHDNESVILKQSLKDVQDIQKIFTDYSRTFNVPASRVNNKLFKHFYNFNIQGFDARSKKPATLELNYAPFKVGNIKLEGVQMQNNKPVNYRVTFFGNTSSLKDLFKDDELGLLSPLSVSGTDSNSFNYTAAEVSTLLQDGKSLTIAGEVIPQGLVAPLLTHTDRLYYNAGQDTAGTFNLHYGSASKGVLYNQLKPAISIYVLLRAIEENYNIKFSNDFIKSTNEDITKLYMWLHRKKGSLLSADFQNSLWLKFIIVSSNNPGFNFGANGFNNIRVPQGYNRFIQIKVQTSSSVKYTIKVLQGNSYTHSSEHTGNSTPISFNNNFELFSAPTNAAEQIRIVLITTEAAVFDFQFEVRDVSDNDSIASYATCNITTTTDFYFNILNELPKIKVIDLLTGIFKMFNLVSYFEDDVIKVLPLDDFYAGSTQTYDITKYLDKGTSEVNSVLPFSLINFKYQEAKTLLAFNHKENFNVEWGNLAYENSGISEASTYNVQLPFENLKFERLIPSSIQWGFSVDSKLDPYIGKPFIFYADKIENAEPISFLSVAGGTAASVPKYFVPSNSVKVKEDSNTINFGAEQSEWLATNFDKSLYKTHYDTFIKGAFSQSRRLSKFQAYVPMSVISNLKLEDKIIVFSNLYKINTLTTNFATGLSSFELINETIDFTTTANQNSSDEAKTIDSSGVTADSTLVRADNAIQRI
jgi:hypothetical protein